MSSNETAAYKIMRSLDVDYVLVIFGGVIGYSGDDINKFLWMVRIAEGEHPKDIRVSSTQSTGARALTVAHLPSFPSVPHWGPGWPGPPEDGARGVRWQHTQRLSCFPPVLLYCCSYSSH